MHSMQMNEEEHFMIDKDMKFVDDEGGLVSLDIDNVSDLEYFYKLVQEKLKVKEIPAPPPSPNNIKFKVKKGEVDVLYPDSREKSCLVLHTQTDKDMNYIINVIENYYETTIPTGYYFNYMTKRDVKKGVCGYIQGLEYNTKYLNAPSLRFICSKEDKEKIHELLKIKKRSSTWLWFPERFIQQFKYVSVETENKYPIYVISKGRAMRQGVYKAPHTVEFLEKCGCDYKIVVEESEYEDYAKSIKRENIIVLPLDFRGEENHKGSTPARNFVHHLCCREDYYAYWILDDNIVDYLYVNNNERYKVRSPIAFKMLEDIMDNFDNLYLVSHQYKMFAPPTDYRNVVQYNSRCYSSILIRTDIPTVNDKGDIWRGVYNEDTDLSLRILKLGLPTANVNCMNCDKLETGGSGGNNEIYKEDNNHSGKAKSESLLEHHKDCVDMVMRYGRHHHKIKTEMFTNNKFERSKDYKESNYCFEYS